MQLILSSGNRTTSMISHIHASGVGSVHGIRIYTDPAQQMITAAVGCTAVDLCDLHDLHDLHDVYGLYDIYMIYMVFMIYIMNLVYMTM